MKNILRLSIKMNMKRNTNERDGRSPFTHWLVPSRRYSGESMSWNRTVGYDWSRIHLPNRYYHCSSHCGSSFSIILQPPPWTPACYEMTTGSGKSLSHSRVSYSCQAGMNGKTQVGNYSSVHWKLGNNVSDVF